MSSVINRLRLRDPTAPPRAVDLGIDERVDSRSLHHPSADLHSSLLGSNRRRSLESYRRLASAYDRHTRRIDRIQRAAVKALDLKDGERVLDVACGTGKCLSQLAGMVGRTGTVIGVEQCPEMAQLARRRIDTETNVTVIESPVEFFETDTVFDAVLMSFTQDVLQTPTAIERILACCRPGTRMAVAGLRFLPWAWGAPINLYNAWRARHYLTTYRGMQAPWKALNRACPEMTVRQTWFAGSCYLAFGQVALP